MRNSFGFFVCFWLYICGCCLGNSKRCFAIYYIVDWISSSIGRGIYYIVWLYHIHLFLYRCDVLDSIRRAIFDLEPNMW